jgi:CheY-like chemotaxis protein
MKESKILVIDDEKEICFLLKEYFEEGGHTVSCSFDGLEGIEKVKSFDPSIILLDMRMPGMDGSEALKKIKELTPSPVLCVSAVIDNNMVEECLQNGAYAYVFKPISLEDLSKTIESALKAK